MRPPLSVRRAGFTLVELTISVGLLAFVITAALSFGRSLRESSSTAIAAGEADAGIARAVDKIAERLRSSGSGWFGAIAPLVPFDEVEYKSVIGYNIGAAAVLTLDERIHLESSPADPENGVDDDGNGIVDDCRVVWTSAVGTPEELSVVIVDRVPQSLEGEIDGNLVDDNDNGLVDERGLALEFDGVGLWVRLTVVEQDHAGRPIQRTVERFVWLRNEMASD